jgi:hypothetical protein
VDDLDLYGIDERAESLILAMVDAGIFLVDSNGAIWRCGQRRKDGSVTPCTPYRAEYPSTNGYLRLRVSVCGVRIRVSAHRIVYRHFYGDIPPGHVVDHEDEVRTNNHPRNLQAVTQSRNTRLSLQRKSSNP